MLKSRMIVNQPITTATTTKRKNKRKEKKRKKEKRKSTVFKNLKSI